MNRRFWFLSVAECLRIPIIFDIDDYVFEPKIATERFVDGIRFVPKAKSTLIIEDAHRTMILQVNLRRSQQIPRRAGRGAGRGTAFFCQTGSIVII
jgi:hypothetical protein